jgi:hypothetical protein
VLVTWEKQILPSLHLPLTEILHGPL